MTLEERVTTDLARDDILSVQKVIVIALYMAPDGLSTNELMAATGMKTKNRRQLQRSLDFLLHTGQVSRHLKPGTGSTSAFYRRAR